MNSIETFVVDALERAARAFESNRMRLEPEDRRAIQAGIRAAVLRPGVLVQFHEHVRIRLPRPYALDGERWNAEQMERAERGCMQTWGPRAASIADVVRDGMEALPDEPLVMLSCEPYRVQELSAYLAAHDKAFPYWSDLRARTHGVIACECRMARLLAIFREDVPVAQPVVAG